MNIEDNLPAPGIEWEINVDRKQASKFGVNIGSIGNVIKLATNGLKLGEYRPDDSNDSIPLYLRYPNEGRTLDTIENLRISTQNGLVPISNFVNIKPNNRTGNIIRVDSKNAIKIGTTRKGIGPAYEDKVGRRGIRVMDLASEKNLSRKIEFTATVLTWPEPTIPTTIARNLFA